MPSTPPLSPAEARARLPLDERRVIDAVHATHGGSPHGLAFALQKVHPFVRKTLARLRAVLKQDATPSAARARAIQECADGLIREGVRQEEAKGLTVACGMGCSHCCRNMPIHFIEEEAMGLAASLEAKTDDERARLLARAMALPKTSEPNSECVFLLDGACTNYEARPLPCRTYHSIDAGWCEQRMREGTNAAVQTVLAFPSDSAVLYGHYVATGAVDTAYVYEMNSFVRRMLEEPEHRARWAAGEALDETELAVKPPGDERARARKRIPLTLVD